MALNTLKCNNLTPLPFKGLIRLLCKDCYYVILVFHCVISMRTELCSSCVCQLSLKNFMMMMMMMMTSLAQRDLVLLVLEATLVHRGVAMLRISLRSNFCVDM